MQRDTCIDIAPTGPIMGVDEATYGETDVTFEPGDILFICSDGLMDAGVQEPFGIARLKELVLANRDKTAEYIADQVISAVTEYAGGPQDDYHSCCATLATLAAPALLIIVLAGGSAQAARPLTERISTKSFDIRYTRGDYLAARRVALAAEDSVGKISSDLGYGSSRLSPKVPIYVNPNHREFVQATGTDRREFVLGRAHSGVERIEVDSQELFGSVEVVTTHEIAHIIVFRLVPAAATMPLWAHQGIAKFESGEWDDSDSQALSDAVNGGNLMRLSDISRQFPKNRQDSGICRKRLLYSLRRRTLRPWELEKNVSANSRNRLFPSGDCRCDRFVVGQA